MDRPGRRNRGYNDNRNRGGPKHPPAGRGYEQMQFVSDTSSNVVQNHSQSYNQPPVEEQYDEDAWVEAPESEEPPAAPRGRQNYSNWSNDKNGQRQSNRSQQNRSERNSNWRQGKLQPNVEITIASKDVGRLIGKGGSKIRELQDNSGARIKIGDEDYGETKVMLTGDEAATSKAKELIEELLYSSSTVLEPVDRTPKQIDWSAMLKKSDDFERERWKNCVQVEKQFYIEDPDITTWHPDSVARFRKANNNIVVMHMDDDDTRPIPNPIKTFEQAFGHYPEVMDTLADQNFEKPSPIQCQAWPIILQGIDLIGIAQTGTGKTIAFLLPALIHIDSQHTPRSERKGPSALVLAPTRELALQIEKEARKYKYRGINSICIYGGGSRKEQINMVTKGVEIIIATPGRLNDLINANVIDVSSVTMLILDEADRMLDMGFEPQIRKILLDIRPDRHTIMTSATWPESVRRLASSYMSKPMLVFIGTLDLAAVHSVRQTVHIIDQEEKRDKLYEFINNMEAEDKVIVFVGKKAIADDIASDLLLNDVPCQSIHGDREQCDRIQALDDLETGSVRILVATDVASRGIDIKDITHIFNYDFPRNIEEYVHRVGRTGRAGRTGESITLMTRGDWSGAKELINILSEAGQEIPDELEAMASRHASWKEKRDLEREQFGGSRRRGDSDGGFGGFGGRGNRGGGGRRRDRW